MVIALVTNLHTFFLRLQDLCDWNAPRLLRLAKNATDTEINSARRIHVCTGNMKVLLQSILSFIRLSHRSRYLR